MSETTAAASAEAAEATAPSPGTKAKLGIAGYRKYVWLFLVLTIGSLWGTIAAYLFAEDFMLSVFGEMETTKPLGIFVLHMPGIAAIAVLLWYDGWRGVANFFRTWVPRRKDLVWIPVLLGLMLLYIFAVRWICQAFGIDVPPDPMSFGEGAVRFLELFYAEVGMVAIAIGFFGFFLPLMHRATGSRIWGGVLTGVAIGVFVAPGYLLASLEQATIWPLYTAQLCTLGIGMSLLMSRMKGSTLFFILPFWMSASGSHFGLYYFQADTQWVQITLFTALVFALYFYLRWRGRGTLPEMHTFPEYLENEYTTRQGAPFPGKGDKSKETAAAGAQPAGEQVETA